jgi:hypothetical protein
MKFYYLIYSAHCMALNLAILLIIVNNMNAPNTCCVHEESIM